MSAKRNKGTLTPNCLLRIKKDIMAIYEEPPPGIFVVPDDNDLTLIHALITGSYDTPYEGGFFYFLLHCPANYPARPPTVTNMTTGSGTVRFNPNLYQSGHVCLSIIGTWGVSSWSPAQSLCSLLLSMQSIMNERPYFNEPGLEEERALLGKSDQYNQIIKHETLRVAVCDMLEGKTSDSNNCPQPLRNIMERSFLEYCDKYVSSAKANLNLEKKKMKDPFGPRMVIFEYDSILKRLRKIKRELDVK